MTIKRIWDWAFPYLRNKYVLTIVLFAVWVGFFDQNNLVDRFSNLKKLKQLNKEKEYYAKKIVEDQQRLKELKSDSDDLEKFARETYYMKKDNEDVYVVVEE
jgi:cell division protein DivIC